MSINFTCQACGHEINMEDEWARQRVKCPICRETVNVPGGKQPSEHSVSDVTHQQISSEQSATNKEQNPPSVSSHTPSSLTAVLAQRSPENIAVYDALMTLSVIVSPHGYRLADGGNIPYLVIGWTQAALHDYVMEERREDEYIEQIGIQELAYLIDEMRDPTTPFSAFAIFFGPEERRRLSADEMEDIFLRLLSETNPASDRIATALKKSDSVESDLKHIREYVSSPTDQRHASHAPEAEHRSVTSGPGDSANQPQSSAPKAVLWEDIFSITNYPQPELDVIVGTAIEEAKRTGRTVPAELQDKDLPQKVMGEYYARQIAQSLMRVAPQCGFQITDQEAFNIAANSLANNLLPAVPLTPHERQIAIEIQYQTIIQYGEKFGSTGESDAALRADAERMVRFGEREPSGLQKAAWKVGEASGCFSVLIFLASITLAISVVLVFTAT